jgi:hypothetical protein
VAAYLTPIDIQQAIAKGVISQIVDEVHRFF